MKILLVIIVLLIAHFQYRLWDPENGSIAGLRGREQQLAELKQQLEEKKQRNDALYAEVEDLRKGQEALEERARDELGMIRTDETFFQVLD
jgi:cell division protein FtsB